MSPKADKRGQTTPPDGRLPRGPHSLSREQVAENQRRRLMRALTDVVGEKGYAAMSVSDVTSLAEVSRAAFYKHYSNKEDCFLATYDALVAAQMAEVTIAFRGGEDVADRARAGIGALFELAMGDPHGLRLAMIEIGALGAAGTQRRERLAEVYEQLLREGLGIPAGPGAIPNPILRALVGGFSKVLYSRVQSGKHAELVALVPDLVTWSTSYQPPPPSLIVLQDPEPRRPAAGFLGGRAPGTLAPELNTASRRGLGGRDIGFSRSYIAQSQRERILDAVANLSAARGYTAFTVDDIAQEAAVSLKAFYEHFADKEDAFLVAYEVGHGKGLGAVMRAYQAAPDWPTGVRAGISALFDFLASEPSFAHLALVDALIATRQTAERSNRGATRYTQVLLPGMEAATELPRPPAVTIEAIAGGIFELCFSYAQQRRIGELSELVPRATYFALAPFIGAEEAGRVATASE